MRENIHCLMLGLFGESLPLYGGTRSELTGAGLSDWDGYALRLTDKFSYRNTYYHQEPRLDIARPGAEWLNSLDFLISSDVFEHVPVPAQSAFDGAAAILRDNGLLVLTVPFHEAETIEHYPDMKDFAVHEIGGEWVMVNKAENGHLTVHRDLIFHGGPGTTLEMRMFGLNDIRGHLEAAGFTDIVVHGNDVPQWGIFHGHQFGVPITARLRRG